MIENDSIEHNIHQSWNEYPHLIADLDDSKNKRHTWRDKQVHVLELAAGTPKKIDWKCNICGHAGILVFGPWREKTV